MGAAELIFNFPVQMLYEARVVVTHVYRAMRWFNTWLDTAILVAVITVFSFDFFLIPPLLTLAMYRVEEWIALCIYLITAILTGQQEGEYLM